MPKSSNKLTADQLGRLIYEIRGERVMLDSDLASIYGVETKALNRAVKRNRHRFPKDFMFQLSEDQWKNLRYQISTSSSGREHQSLRYQIGTSSLGHGGRRSRPMGFHRARRDYGSQCSEQSASRADERVRGTCVFENASIAR